MNKNTKALIALFILALSVCMVATIFEDGDSEAAGDSTLSFAASTGGNVVGWRWAPPDYTVKMYFNSPYSVDAGTEIHLEAVPETGYHFVYWQVGSSTVSTSTTYTFNMPSGTYSVTAMFAQDYTYTLTYDANGGSGAPAAQSYGPTPDGTHSFTIPNTTPTRSGYWNFLGWSFNQYAAAADYTAGQSVQLDSSWPQRTIYAVWQEIPTYWVTGSKNIDAAGTLVGYYYDATNVKVYFPGNEKLLPAGTRAGFERTTNTGYTWTGWKYNNVIVSQASYYEITTPASNVLIEGNWQLDPSYTIYTLTYDDNGGSGGPGTVTYGPTQDASHDFTVPNTTPTRSGYSFLGWADNSLAQTADYEVGDTISVSSPTSKTVYAVWQEVITYNYELSYNANGGSGAPAAQTASSTLTQYPFTVSDTVPTRSGYSFLGWGHTADATVAAFHAGDTITLQSSNPTKEIFAVWEIKYELTFVSSNSYYGSVVGYRLMPPDYETEIAFLSPYMADAGMHIKLVASPDTDCHFVNWTSNGVEVSTSATYIFTMPSNDYPLVANFEQDETTKLYVLTYDDNGGSGGPGYESHNTTANHYDFRVGNDDPTRAGYDFLGWADTADAEAAPYQYGDIITLTYPTLTKTIYAVWIVHSTPTYTYTLKFNGNGGSGTPVTMSAEGSSLTFSFTIPDTKPSKEGTIFMGWSTAPTATSAQYTPGSICIVGADQTTELFAVYNEDNSFSFSFDYLIKQIAQTFFGGSTSLAGLALIIICWLLIVAILANFKAPVSYSVAPMIPIVIIFAAMGIVSTDITMIIIIVCAVLSAAAVRTAVKGD